MPRRQFLDSCAFRLPSLGPVFSVWDGSFMTRTCSGKYQAVLDTGPAPYSVSSAMKNRALMDSVSSLVEMVGESRCQGRLRHRCGGLRSLTAVFRVASYYPPGYEPTLLSWTWVQFLHFIRQQKRVRWTLFVVW